MTVVERTPGPRDRISHEKRRQMGHLAIPLSSDL